MDSSDRFLIIAVAIMAGCALFTQCDKETRERYELREKNEALVEQVHDLEYQIDTAESWIAIYEEELEVEKKRSYFYQKERGTL